MRFAFVLFVLAAMTMTGIEVASTLIGIGQVDEGRVAGGVVSITTIGERVESG